jgi:predicted metal-dependent hydrolase
MRRELKSSKLVNYSLNNQKITFDLKLHLWNAAHILTGSLDASDYRQPVMTLLFLKRLNDSFEENAEKLIKQGRSQKEAYENKNRHYSFVPKNDNNNYNIRIKSLYEDWLAHRSEEIFKRKVIEFSKILKVNPKKINIKNLKNRWGSLTKERQINLNLNLIKAPEDVIDYIIMHELCHFIVKGHSQVYSKL